MEKYFYCIFNEFNFFFFLLSIFSVSFVTFFFFFSFTVFWLIGMLYVRGSAARSFPVTWLCPRDPNRQTRPQYIALPSIYWNIIVDNWLMALPSGAKQRGSVLLSLSLSTLSFVSSIRCTSPCIYILIYLIIQLWSI